MEEKNLFEEFSLSLAKEIECIEKTSGDATFILRNGQLIEDSGGNFLYEFITDTPIDLESDTPISIRYGDETIRGSIVAIDGLKVILSLSQNVGSSVPEIRITANASFLLKSLQERIEDIKAKRLSLNTDIAMKAFGFKKSSTGKDDNFLTAKDSNDSSEEQRAAIAQSLGSEITFIWGPPGTGKTTVLSYLASEILARESDILFVSHTNVAIDNALEKIAKILKERSDSKYLDGKIFRIGKPYVENLFKDWPELDLNHWIEEKGKDLYKKLLELESKKEKEQIAIGEINNFLELLSARENYKKEVGQLEKNIKDTKVDIRNIEKEISESNKKIGITNEKIKEAENLNVVSRFLTGKNPKKLGKVLNEMASSVEKRGDKLSELSRALEEKSNDLIKTNKNYLVCEEKISKDSLNKYNFDKNSLLQKVEKQKDIIQEIGKQINVVKEKIANLEHDLINEAKLIGTTITKGYLNQNIYSRKFDAVIVDEASMAQLPALFFNCSLALSRIIIIGDFRQLGPISMSEDELAKKWLQRDIFEVSGVSKNVNEGIGEEKIAILKEQRRMPKKIVQIINKTIYADNKLVTKKSRDKEKTDKLVVDSEPFPGESLVVCDTSEFNPWCSTSPSKSPFNIYNAFLSIYLTERAISSKNVKKEDIAVIAPYRAQIRLIHKLLAEREFSDVVPASVHKFQGRERKLIIFDLVEGPIRSIRWLGGRFDSDAMRIINVALTRTEAKLILIANVKYLQKNLEEGSILKQVLSEAIKDCPSINTQKFFPFIKIPLKRTKSLKIDEVIPQLYNQAYFYKAFQDDLLQAKKEIVIVSPFLTHNRLASFEGVFRELQKKEIKTFIFTRPLWKQGMSYNAVKELKGNLRKLGIELNDDRPLSHEKISIIDGKILWSGSLNILSHKDSSELMMRFNTKSSFSDEVLKLCGINVQRLIKDNILDKKIQKLNKEGVGFCPNGHPFIVKRGRTGIFVSCSRFPSCKEKLPLSLSIIGDVFGEEYLTCEKCGSPMGIKFNPKRKSRFLGCPKYPNCRFTRPI